MKTVSDSSKILIVFLLFSFLFLQVNPQMQIFVSDEETIQENLSTISNIDDYIRYYESQDNHNHDNHNGDEDYEKDGIDEDWMFGKIKSKF